ncbi:hypothetical protein [Bacteriophage sp.]|nr:hypothetical protein [Bacteriophage sp.]
MTTIHDKLRAALLARGWQPVETRSGRTALTKSLVGRTSDGQVRPVPGFLFLGVSGSLRSARRNCFTESRPVDKKYYDKVLAEGEAILNPSPADLLKGLED